jgi:hypothetical protein
MVEPIESIAPDDPGAHYYCKRREIASVIDRSASVRLWLERTGP